MMMRRITIPSTTTAPLSEYERIGARRGVSEGLCPTALIDKKLVSGAFFCDYF